MNTSEHIFGSSQPDAGGNTGDDATEDTRRGAAAAGRTDDARAAARLLEMTAREIEQWRSQAQDEAAGIVASGREEAAELVRAARDEADRLVGSAREEAARAMDDARVEAYQVRKETTAVRESHEAEIARLQQVEASHRQRLRQHLTAMLDQVDSADRDGEH